MLKTQNHRRKLNVLPFSDSVRLIKLKKLTASNREKFRDLWCRQAQAGQCRIIKNFKISKEK